MNEITILPYILLSVTINGLAQIIWKKGAKEKIGKNFIKAMLKPKIITGLIMYAFSALIWILVLSKTEVSFAFPFISLGYVITTILSHLVLKEKVNKQRILGVIIIIIGVIIVGGSM